MGFFLVGQVASHVFMGWLLPGLGVLRPPGAKPPSDVELYGTGDIRGVQRAFLAMYIGTLCPPAGHDVRIYNDKDCFVRELSAALLSSNQRIRIWAVICMHLSDYQVKFISREIRTILL